MHGLPMFTHVFVVVSSCTDRLKELPKKISNYSVLKTENTYEIFSILDIKVI